MSTQRLNQVQQNDKPVLVYATFPTLGAAEAAGRRLVEARLAACVNILPGMTSIYRWEGRIELASEVVMIIKTRGDRADAVMRDVRAHHEYTTPALLVLPVLDGSPEYLQWLSIESSP